MAWAQPARRLVPGEQTSRTGRWKERKHAVNVSSAHSPDSPMVARRLGEEARFLARINSVVTAPTALRAGLSSRRPLAHKSGKTPKSGCSSQRRASRRKTRGRFPGPSRSWPAESPDPARGPRRLASKAGQPDLQAQRRPEDRQGPDRLGPWLRHARGPRRQLNSLGMLSAPGLSDRLGLPRRMTSGDTRFEDPGIVHC
jgi:hypothetical protein